MSVLDPLIVIRAVHLAAATTSAGAMFFALALAQPSLASEVTEARDFGRRNDRLIILALALALLSGAAWALLVAMRIAGTGASTVLTDGALATLLIDTRFGQVSIIRALLLVAALALWPTARWRSIAAVAAAAMLAALAWIGHSGAGIGTEGWIQVIADMAHLLAAGLWLGSLPALALLLAAAGKHDASAQAVRRFSTFGIGAVGTLLVTGIIIAWLMTDSIASIVRSDYGLILIAKVAVFAAMVSVASVNRLRLTPRLPATANAIRRNSLIEAGLGLVVMALVGLLGTLPPPRHVHIATSDIPEGAAYTHIHGETGMADVTINPGQAGPATVDIRLSNDDFSPMSARGVTIALSRPGIQPIVAKANRLETDLWQARVAPSENGIWSVTIDIEREDAPPIRLDAPVVLAPAGPQNR